MRPLVALALVAPALAGCLAPAPAEDDPARARGTSAVGAGPFAFQILDYDFGRETIADAEGRPWSLQIRGSIHVPEALGRLPVVVHMHGSANACHADALPARTPPFGNGTHFGYDACQPGSPGVRRVESFRGYDYISEKLASYGFLVVSVDGGELQGYTATRCALQFGRASVGLDGDECYGEHLLRARLVLRTLDHLRLADSCEGPLGSLLNERVDLSRIGLQGHSRGGPAVSWAQEENRGRPEDRRFGIRALLGIGSGSHDQPSEGVAYATVVEYCASFNPAGAPATFDDVRFQVGPHPKYQWVVMGANHDFHNTEWSYDDDGAYDAAGKPKTDPHCGAFAPEGARLEASDQRRLAAALATAFFRSHVTDEGGSIEWLSGQVEPPADACPPYSPDCRGLLHVSFHPGEGDRIVIDGALTEAALAANALGGASRFLGSARWCDPREDCLALPRVHGRAPRLVLGWSEPGAAWRTGIPATAGDWSAFEWVSVRAAVTHDAKNDPTAPLDVRFVLADGRGRSASVLASDHSDALFYPPGEENARGILNEMRVPLRVFEGIDLATVRSLSLEFTAPTGEVQLTDLLVGRGPDAHAVDRSEGSPQPSQPAEPRARHSS